MGLFNNCGHAAVRAATQSPDTATVSIPCFDSSVDISDWEGWFFDTIYVDNDNMLTCNAVGLDSLKLELVTRDMIVDMRDPDALDKIKGFLAPLSGFKRMDARYDVCIDSIVDEEYGVFECMGSIVLSADFADSCIERSQQINQFVCELMLTSNNNQAKVPPMTALYIGHNTSIPSKQTHNAACNINNLFELTSNDILDGWRHEEELDIFGYARTIDVRARVATPQFITFSVFDYDRTGLGHGMYTETLYTFDFDNGRKLANNDLFLPAALDEVKLLLFESMFIDPKFSDSHQGIETVKDIEEMCEYRSSQSSFLFDSEFEASEADCKFVLPDGALANDGIVFSFQPYEIDYWAAGAYHFTVPYSKLMPYLTPKAKRLISGCYHNIVPPALIQ